MCCCCVVQVRLVLEYCDKGCLRTALDDGVFILGEYLIFTALFKYTTFIYLLSLYFSYLCIFKFCFYLLLPPFRSIRDNE